jgi:TrmH family RNA methyltransferase
MISNSQVKQIKALSIKKFRDESGLFLAEGTKLVLELLDCFKLELIVATPDWISQYGRDIVLNIQEVRPDELQKVSCLKTTQGVLAVFKKPNNQISDIDSINNLNLVLDDVQDPGNLGTIIRIADWFGIHDIICSLHSADAFSPKTVQATMGALARVRVHYVDLEQFLNSQAQSIPIFGTFMDGNSIYTEKLSANGIIVMGNEGNGISPKIEKLVTNKLLIPNFPANEKTSESLNVGVATAIVCAEFRRGKI